MAAHQELGHRQGVVDRSLRMPDGALHVAIELLTRETHQILLSAGGFGHLPGNRRLVVTGVVKADRERLHRCLAHG